MTLCVVTLCLVAPWVWPFGAWEAWGAWGRPAAWALCGEANSARHTPKTTPQVTPSRIPMQRAPPAARIEISIERARRRSPFTDLIACTCPLEGYRDHAESGLAEKTH